MANLFGLAQGMARGRVPSARIAVYKVCWSVGCDDADILAALDDAIANGVDIISVSIGSPARDYLRDPIAIGAFHALEKEYSHQLLQAIVDPSLPPSLTSRHVLSQSLLAPSNRKFFTKVLLGNDKTYEEISINTFDLKRKVYPLIYGGYAPNVSTGFDASISR
ncbi:hypothetical protein NL676_034889 [Syzygium grande]|nr:hypothetical protein NL676_034889 [Syzygium grande]